MICEMSGWTWGVFLAAQEPVRACIFAPEGPASPVKEQGRGVTFWVAPSGKVPGIRGNLVHFPAGNVDFTVIFAIFPGKVNRISTNSRHFPPVILFPALFCIYAFGESEPICHFPGHKQRSGSSSTSRQKFRWRNVQQLAERAIMNE